MKSRWFTTEKIAVFSLIITIIAAIGSWFVVPEFRKVFSLPSENNTQVQLQDTIVGFRVVKQTQDSVTLDVDYIYDPIWGQRVYIGGCLYDNGTKIGNIPKSLGGFCGYKNTMVSSVGSGTVRTTIKPFIKNHTYSDELELFLYKYGPNETTIVSRRFPLVQQWQPED